ncbi:Beta,beta-carotene 9',10'-oxygenase [Frankliniella fusca]|uniref:Beta,beta-carotene 9',10'-oxygenase n=1 Tax=Frankliniella fusca TaxID=407009 RepID=A0AAE1GWX7_9NEOP|nr:Beta,beta-carotene 9',10'-oxygenase [Frankliniella fusca]
MKIFMMRNHSVFILVWMKVSSVNAEVPQDNCDDESDSDEILDQAPNLHLSVSEKIKLLLLLAIKKKHKLTYSAAEDVIELLGLSEDVSFLPSKHLMKSAIEKYSFGLQEHHVCPSCGEYIGIVTEKSLECDVPACGDSMSIFGADVCSVETDVEVNKNNRSMFLYLKLKDQLQALLQSLPDNVQLDMNDRKKINCHNYEDIYDGAMYKIFQSSDTITLNFFIDGLQVATSSKQSAWPVLLTVNELPLELRRKHVLMASLWLSKKKPSCNQYLKPFVAELLELARTGVSYRRNSIVKSVKVKGCCCISDTVARPMIRNSTQFNGKFGCGFCLHPGVRMANGKGSCRSYTTSTSVYPERTHQEVMHLAARAEVRGIPQSGIKGTSILSRLPDFDVVRCIDLDSFHAVVNVAKRFVNLWLTSPHKNTPVPDFKIHDKIKILDKRLMAITPTLEVSRAPRSLTERSDYRGHEWFHFVLFYSVPVLKNVLPARFLNHWSLFVKGLAILMQNSLAKSEVIYADRFLHQFVSGIDNLYGPQNVIFSCHLLTHLKRSVQDFAQPFTHSAFIYESFNNEIKESVHSSNGVAKQIVKAMQLKFALVKMEQELRVDMTDKQRAYLDKLNLRGKQLANPSLQLESAAMLGKPKTERISKEMRLAVLQAGGVCRPDNVCDFYERFRIHGEVFHATSYSRVSKRNNCVVLLESERVFLIESALVVSDECFIAGHYYQDRKDTKLSSVDLPHLRILKSTPGIVLQCNRPSDIVSKLINFTVQVSPEETLNLACINVLLMEMLS